MQDIGMQGNNENGINATSNQRYDNAKNRPLIRLTPKGLKTAGIILFLIGFILYGVFMPTLLIGRYGNLTLSKIGQILNVSGMVLFAFGALWESLFPNLSHMGRIIELDPNDESEDL